jgi:hypothetical protein
MDRSVLRLGAGLLIGFAAASCNCEGGGLINLKPLLVPDPTMIEFGDVAIGDLRIRSSKLQNKGGVPLQIKSFKFQSPTTDFVFATPVPDVIGAQSSIDFNFLFQPTSVGDKTAVVAIDTNDGKGTHTITLHGAGIQADVIATHDGDQCGTTDSSMSFGSVAPMMRVDRTITVKDTGSAPVNVLSVTLDMGSDSQFSLDPFTPTTLKPGDTVAIHAHFNVDHGGPATGGITITTNSPSMPTIAISLCGAGVAPALCASPLDLGPVAIGTSTTGTLHVTSCGDQPVDVSAIALSMDASHMSSAGFMITAPPMVPQTLAPMSGIDVPIQFTASAIGPAKAWIEADSTAYGRPQSYFPITAIGAEPCTLDVQPQMIDFLNVMAGHTATKNVLVTNAGASACTVTSVAITRGMSVFSLSPAPSLPLVIASGGASILQVQYAPTATSMNDMGTLTVVGGVTKTVSLIGNPPAPSGCQLDITPSFINFGVVPPNTVRSAGVALNNVSQDPCFVMNVQLEQGSSPDLHNTAGTFNIILPGQSAQLSVTYTPHSTGSAQGALLISSSDVVTPMVRVPIFGSSGASGICVHPTNLPFGPVSGFSTQSFTISACGSRDVTVTALDWTRPDASFALSSPPALPFTLHAGQSRSVDVTFTVRDMIGHTAVDTVRSDDPASPAIDVSMTGGPQIVPASAGRYLYYWQIPNPIGGDIMQLPLQGATNPTPYWGPRTGKQCSGCHNVSPDGRYVALVELPSFRIIDTTSNISLSLPNGGISINFFSWNPDPNTTPPYQYAYDDGSDIHIASIFDGELRVLQGANDPTLSEEMPSWGPNHTIAFVRGMMRAQTNTNNGNGSWGFDGPCDVLVVSESGGTAQLVPGASNNGMGNYYPRFSPNGKWIAFTQSAQAMSSIAASDAQLRLARSDLSGVLPLMTINGAMGATSYPTWSVDGRYLSFSSNRPGGAGDWDIYIAPIDPDSGVDSPAMNVTQANTPAFEHAAQWSP